jgi:hypothetical protein
MFRLCPYLLEHHCHVQDMKHIPLEHPDFLDLLIIQNNEQHGIAFVEQLDQLLNNSLNEIGLEHAPDQLNVDINAEFALYLSEHQSFFHNFQRQDNIIFELCSYLFEHHCLLRNPVLFKCFLHLRQDTKFSPSSDVWNPLSLKISYLSSRWRTLRKRPGF